MHEHTKTPWIPIAPLLEGYQASVIGSNGEVVCHFGDGGNGKEAQLANAALIVKAVNCHDQLVNALRALYDEQNGSPLETRAVDWTMAMHQAKAALSKAEEGGGA